MEAVRCYNCGSRESHAYAEENGFILVKCASCGVLYVCNPPAAQSVSQAVQLGEHIGERTIQVTGRRHRAKVTRYLRVLADLYEPGFFTKPIEWLDIGCGYGELLMSLDRLSAVVHSAGVEPNDAKRAAATRLALNVTSSLPPGAGPFNVISALNVYSHLLDPVETIASWRLLLAAGGELIIQTGDTAGLVAAAHPRPFHLPDHLTFTSRSILVGTLERLGFEVVAVKTYPMVERTPAALAREVAKAVLPGHNSLLRYAVDRAYDTDLWVRARLRAESQSLL